VNIVHEDDGARALSLARIDEWAGSRLTPSEHSERRILLCRLGAAGRLVAGKKWSVRRYPGAGEYSSRTIFLDTEKDGREVVTWEGWTRNWKQDWAQIQKGEIEGTSFRT